MTVRSSTLNLFLQGGGPRKWQLNLISIYNIPEILIQRGFENVSEGQVSETLVDEKAYPNIYTNRHSFIETFAKKTFRLQVRDMIFQNKQAEKIEFHFESNFVNQQKFGKTVELLLAYLCVKEFQALSSSFGVKIKNAPDGGDFDCITIFQHALVHFEIKSGDIKNIGVEVFQSFLKRHSFLAPDASVLFLDYQGGGDKLDETIKKFMGLEIDKRNKVQLIRKIHDEGKKFYTLNSDILVFDLHNNGDILSNLRSAMRYFHRFNSRIKAMSYRHIDPKELGYDSERIL